MRRPAGGEFPEMIFAHQRSERLRETLGAPARAPARSDPGGATTEAVSLADADRTKCACQAAPLSANASVRLPAESLSETRLSAPASRHTRARRLCHDRRACRHGCRRSQGFALWFITLIE